jgi:DNA-directed RNA polymerase subunit N (RpoN/RPB10)
MCTRMLIVDHFDALIGEIKLMVKILDELGVHN